MVTHTRVLRATVPFQEKEREREGEREREENGWTATLETQSDGGGGSNSSKLRAREVPLINNVTIMKARAAATTSYSF